MKVKLSPLNEYVYPVMNDKKIKIYEHISYGGDKSVTVPCGFVSNLIYEKVVKHKKKNQFAQGYTSEMKYIKNRLAKTNLERVKAGSLAQDNRT